MELPVRCSAFAYRASLCCRADRALSKSHSSSSHASLRHTIIDQSEYRLRRMIRSYSDDCTFGRNRNPAETQISVTAVTVTGPKLKISVMAVTVTRPKLIFQLRS